MRILVIGGSGFLGSHVVDSLAAHGHLVTVFDRTALAPVSHPSHLVTFVRGNIFDPNAVSQALDGHDWVVHCVAATVPATADGDPAREFRTVVPATVDLLSQCAARGIGFAFLSSGGTIYGEGGDVPCAETHRLHPRTPYAIAKVAIEQYVEYFHATQGMPALIFRVANPYGPRQRSDRPQGVIPVLLRNIAAGRTVDIIGDGTAVRDYIHVRDMATMITRAVMSDRAAHLIYNIGSGTGVSLLNLLEIIEDVTGVSPPRNHLPAPASFVHQIVLDTTRFTTDFHTPTLVPLAVGVDELWKSMNEATLPSLSSPVTLIGGSE